MNIRDNRKNELLLDKEEELAGAENLSEEEAGDEVFDIPAIEKGKYVEGIGRRKESSARVRLWANTDKTVMDINVNDKSYTDYFPLLYLQKTADAPLRKLRVFDAYKVTVKVSGGGSRGQSEAVRLGLARALLTVNPQWRARFKKAGFLTRDPRVVERKKYGLHKARRAPQWSKR